MRDLINPEYRYFRSDAVETPPSCCFSSPARAQENRVTTTTASAGNSQTTTASTTTTTAAPTTTTTTLPALTGLTYTEIATGLPFPVLFTFRPWDGQNFILTKNGQVWMLTDNGPELFLDISDRVTNDGERGLLGMAWHPIDPERLFLHYSDRNGDTVISEFVDGEEKQILFVPQPAPNHNGGMIEFGPDGYLYIALGDGGGGGDTFGTGQPVDDLLANLLADRRRRRRSIRHTRWQSLLRRIRGSGSVGERTSQSLAVFVRRGAYLHR